MSCIENRGREASVPASFSGGPGLISRPGDRIFREVLRGFFFFSFSGQIPRWHQKFGHFNFNSISS